MKHITLKVILFLLILTSCTSEITDWQGQPDAGDTDGNTDIDTDSDSDGDGDSDTDTETESETDTETETESDTGTDTDADADTDTDTGTETDSETDTGPDTDTGSDTDIPGDCIGPGVYLATWTPTEGRCWEKDPPTTAQTYVDADARCAALSLDGANDWRVPNINELYTLIDGCPGAVNCGVFDSSCLYDYCADMCSVCPLFGGPGVGGCYWDTSLTGNCSTAVYWSSSPQVGISYTMNWCIHFGSGGYTFVGASIAHVRCIRVP